MSTMKRTVVSLAAAFALASTSALAQGVKMSDQQLDQVTAAGAVSLVVITNRGNAGVGRNLDLQSGPHGTCINCAALPATSNEGRASGVVVLQNRKFTVENPIIRCVGTGLLGLC